MRRYFNIIYWGLAILLLSGIFLSAASNFTSSLLLALTILPGVILAKFFLRDISFSKLWKGVYHLTLLAIVVLLFEYLSILIIDINFFHYGLGESADIIFNPLFIWLLIISLISLEKLIEIKLDTISPPEMERYIEFISDRKRVLLEIDTITYIESNDDEVWVRTADALSYRTKMNISHWQMVLDNRFVRIHRSFLVNRLHITKATPTKVWIGSKQLEISRKYRDIN